MTEEIKSLPDADCDTGGLCGRDLLGMELLSKGCDSQ